MKKKSNAIVYDSRISKNKIVLIFKYYFLLRFRDYFQDSLYFIISVINKRKKKQKIKINGKVNPNEKLKKNKTKK